MHTKGQWFHGVDLRDITREQDTIVQSDNGDVICETNKPMDAVLISAAPNLLEACKACLDYMLDDKSSDVSGAKALSLIQAAISKAEGK